MVWRYSRNSGYRQFWGRYAAQNAPRYRFVNDQHGLSAWNYSDPDNMQQRRDRRADRIRSSIMRYRQNSGIRPMGPRSLFFNRSGRLRNFQPQVMRRGQRLRGFRHSAPAA